MSDTPKSMVENAYDNISDWYLQWVEAEGWRSPRERYALKVFAEFQSSPSILELGCGPGVPTLKMLLEHGANVVANDISAKHIAMAKVRCPDAGLIHGDMAGLNFKPETFHGVVSFFTLFHLPRSELETMLTKVYLWLKPGGVFVFNLATVDEEEIHGELLGHGMFWSSYNVRESKRLLGNVGFEIIEVELLTAGDGNLKEGDPDFESEFMWVAAKRPILG